MKIELDTNIVELIDKHHQKNQDKPRTYLGGSIIGHPCDRWLWLSFRWAVVEKFEGRILRLFRRGHREEETIVADLVAIGINIHSDQRAVPMPKHCGGHIDGIGEGVLGAEKTPHLLEFKTHAKKSFDDLEKNGLKKSKPMHWCQMQFYMHGLGLKRGLYVAVCKDDDRMYADRVEYDKDAAKQLIERAERIVSAERMPDPISTNPSWYQCKFCPAHSFCHKERLTKLVNCRTCAHATAEDDGEWSCARWQSKGIPVDYQRTGCDSHVLHPDLVPWPMKDSGSPYEAVYEINGVDVRNGEGDAHVFTSQELIAGGDACAHELVRGVRETFPGATVKEVRTIEEEEIPF